MILLVYPDCSSPSWQFCYMFLSSVLGEGYLPNVSFCYRWTYLRFPAFLCGSVFWSRSTWSQTCVFCFCFCFFICLFLATKVGGRTISFKEMRVGQTWGLCMRLKRMNDRECEGKILRHMLSPVFRFYLYVLFFSLSIPEPWKTPFVSCCYLIFCLFNAGFPVVKLFSHFKLWTHYLYL